MSLDHRPVVHPIDVIAREHQQVLGAPLGHALDLAVELETLCEQYWRTVQIGPPRLLPDAGFVDTVRLYSKIYNGIDLNIWKPLHTTSTMEGGMRTPSVAPAAMKPAWRPMTSKMKTLVEVSHMEATSMAASRVDTATYLATEPNPGQLSVRGRSLSMVLGT